MVHGCRASVQTNIRSRVAMGSLHDCDHVTNFW